MVESPHVSIDPRSLPPAARKLREPLEEQLTSALRVATERVRGEYTGGTSAEVCDRLLAATRELLHPDIAAAFQPDRGEFCRVAHTIVAERAAR